MEKNIIVTDASGRRIGLTYQKRADGLVKNGRAEYVSENEIHIFDKNFTSIEAVEKMEDNKMSDFENKENKIYFNAREWTVCSGQAAAKAERTFVTDFENNLSEAFCIGDKTQNTTEIGTKQLMLNKNEKYTFYFWIKIDKNIKYDAVCQLEIIYNGDYENRRVYVLSNSNIKPAKVTDGWRLYEIPFVTEENEYTQLKFQAKSSICSIIPGKEAKFYCSLPDDGCIESNSDSSAAYDEENTDDATDPFHNISNSFREFFGQFDSSAKSNYEKDNTRKDNNQEKNDPFAAFNEFARQVKRDVQREVNKNIRNDIYSDIKAMKDEIVNEIKNTFKNDDN